MERETNGKSIDELFWEFKAWEKESDRLQRLSELRREQPDAAAAIEEMLACEDKIGSFMVISDEYSDGFPDNDSRDGSASHAEAMDATLDSQPSSDSAGMGKIGRSRVPTQIGPYKLLEPIGEGGMGLVYLAQQSKPVRRKVAVKIIKPGMDSRQVIARFEAERQALAMMDHPSIAKVLDAGSTESGLPYFVMELVRGIPISEYCDRARMPTKERLELFRDACHAIQHAHNKGVIHRDIKPSNVLVTEQDGMPLVKVIDFGIAKALTDNLTDKTMFTGMFQMLGTPLYMSPEQASLSNVDVDTRSDVYSLGVMLYEMVSGSLPIDQDQIKELSFDELRQRICDTEPPRPSKRLSTLRDADRGTVAARRSADVKAMHRIVTSELDWIVMRSIEKDRARRYQSARELGEDIQRYLTGDAVEACPPSTIYRLQKFYHRNRLPVLSTSLVFLALSFATTFSIWQTGKATRAKQEAEVNAETAEAKADEAEAILEFLITDVLKSAKPIKALGREMTVVEMLAEAEKKIGTSFDDRPLVKASLQEAIASTYDALDDWKSAERHSAAALATRRKLLGDGHSDSIQSMFTHARILIQLNRASEARTLYESALASCKKISPSPDLLTLRAMFGISWCEYLQSNYLESLRLLDQILAVESDPKTATGIPYKLSVRNSKALALSALGRIEDALKTQKALCQDASLELAENHPTLLQFKSALAGMYKKSQDYANASRIYREIIAGRESIYGPNARKTLLSKRDFAALKVSAGDYVAAKAQMESLLPVFLEELGAADSGTGTLYHDLVRACSKLGELQAAKEYATKAINIRVLTDGETHPNTLIAKMDLAKIQGSLGELDSALSLIDEVIQQYTDVRGAMDYFTLSAKANKAEILFDAGRYAESAALHQNVYEQRIELNGQTHLSTLASADAISKVFGRLGKREEVLRVCQPLLENHSEQIPEAVRQSLSSRVGVALLSLGRARDSTRYFEESHRLAQNRQGDCGADTLMARINLGFALATMGDFDRGVELLKSVLEANCENLDAETANGARHNLAAVSSSRCESIGLQFGVSDELRKLSIVMGREAVTYTESLPSAPSSHMRLLGDDAEFIGASTRRKLAVGLLGNQQYEEALEQISTADALQGGNDPAYCFIEAAALYWLGKDEKGDQCFEEANRWLLSKDDVAIRTIQFRDVADRAIRETTPAYAAYQEKDWARAQQLYEKNLERYQAMGRPAPAIALQRLANCAANQRQFEKAADLYRRSLTELKNFKSSPSFVTSTRNLMNVLHAEEKLDESIEIAEEVIPIERLKKLEPGKNDERLYRLYARQYSNLAWSLSVKDPPKAGYRKKAVEYAQLAARLQEVSNHFNNLGVAYHQNGRYADAVEALNKADLMIEGGDREHRMFLAMAHWQLGNREDAKKFYDEAIAWQEEQEVLAEEQTRFRRMAEELMGIAAGAASEEPELIK